MTQYAGRLHARLNRRGLDLAETSYPAGQRIDRHMHDLPMIVLVMAGAMTEHVRGRELQCPAGTVLFHPAGEIHAHRFGTSSSRCLVLQLGLRWMQRLEVYGHGIPNGPIAGIDETATGTGRLLHTEFRRGAGAITAALDGLTLALLAAIARNPTPSAERRPLFLNRVLDRLNDDVGSNVGLASLAVLAGVSPSHLARTFRQRHGCTLGEYVRRLRVERARSELTEGDESLTQIAVRLGFFDQAHFTRTFKAHVGCTPGEYRRACGHGRIN